MPLALAIIGLTSALGTAIGGVVAANAQKKASEQQAQAAQDQLAAAKVSAQSTATASSSIGGISASDALPIAAIAAAAILLRRS